MALIAKIAGYQQLYQVMDYEVQMPKPCADVGATYLCQHKRSGRQRSDACSVPHTALCSGSSLFLLPTGRFLMVDEAASVI